MIKKLSIALLVLCSFCFVGCNVQNADTDSDISNPDSGVNTPDGSGSGSNKDDEHITGADIIVHKDFVSFENMQNFYSKMNDKNELSLCLPLLDSNKYNVSYLFSGVCVASSYKDTEAYRADYLFSYYGGEIYTLDEADNRQLSCFFMTLSNVNSFDGQTDKVSYQFDRLTPGEDKIYNFYFNENTAPFLRVKIYTESVDDNKAADLLNDIVNSIVKL